MSAKITVHCDSTGRTYTLKRKLAEKKVARGHFRWRDNFNIEEVPRALHSAQTAVRGFWDGPFGIGNALPFTRIPNRLCSPPKLHYSIPAAGARMRRVCVACINGIEHVHGGFANAEELLEIS